MTLSKDEVKSIRHESQKTEHKTEKPIESPKKSKKIMLISSLVVVLIVVGIGFSFANSQKPAFLDDFAKCLTEKGAVMYGATWCKYTSAQKGMFENSMKFIDYRDFSEHSDVRITPTWFIDGNKYENVQSLDKLASVTGCVIGG
tara:strand:+ start:1324 stop:1755 length:432 start_codon:yes stop_codon:yes gene_type:complete